MRSEQEHIGAGAVVERWRGAEWCRGAEVVQRCRWCNRGSEVVEEGAEEVQMCRVAEVQSCRNAGADMIEKCRRGAEEYKCRCRVSAK